jgi:hypothetical protein
MKLPRFRTAGIMVAVAIAAINFWVIHAMLPSAIAAGGLLVFGALPMANILAAA